MCHVALRVVLLGVFNIRLCLWNLFLGSIVGLRLVVVWVRYLGLLVYTGLGGVVGLLFVPAFMP